MNKKLPFNKKNSPYYIDVANSQIELDRVAEIAITKTLAGNRQKIKNKIIQLSTIQWKLLSKYKILRSDSRSVARLGRGFNSAIAGKNLEINHRVTKAFESIIQESTLDPGFTYKKLLEADLNDELLLEVFHFFKGDLTVIYEPEYEEILILLEENRQIENILVRSCLKLAKEIAKRYGSSVFGIDEEDAVQEANKGLVEAARLYNPNFTKDGRRVRFNTYAHRCAEMIVKEWIMETSRLVRVPKAKLRRVFIVIEASNQIEGNRTDLIKLADLSNEIMASRLRRELRPTEKLTIDDVAECINLLQGNSVAFDYKVTGGDGDKDGKVKTIGEMLPDSGISSEAQVDKTLAIERIKRAVNALLTPLEREVIFKRYLDTTHNTKRSSGVRPYDEVGKELQALMGRTVSREWVRQIEVGALEKLKIGVPDLQDIIELGILSED